ncbi:MAG: methylmalonyl-CoA mutase family protein, partial [Flavobacterium sp.]|nr:methylmalonyl-CoA mutase family protein [Flavobacterium sp.]
NAIEADYIQTEIANAAYQYQNQIEDGSQVIVGVNKFLVEESPNMNVFRVNDSIRAVQIKKLEALKSERNTKMVEASLNKLREAAVDGTNLMPHILHSVEQYATLGEMANTLRDVFGEHR